MIAHLTGTVRAKKPLYLILDVHGVGYKVFCTERTLGGTALGEERSLHTYLAVREDALDLFGFPSSEELELFTLLLSVSGIGPRSALGIIGLESPDRLMSAIAQGDVGYLTKVSGVGKKSAEKIVLELRDKVSVLNISDITSIRHEDEDIIEALKALGYRAEDARDVVRTLPNDALSPSDRIKEALKLLALR